MGKSSTVVATVPTAQLQTQLDALRQRVPDGAIAGSAGEWPGSFETGWGKGRVLFDQAGFAVVVARTLRHKRIPVAILHQDKTGDYVRASGAQVVLAVGVVENDLEDVTQLLARIAVRLCELRASGWHITSKQRGSTRKNISRFPFAGSVTDPLTDQIAYCFPVKTSRSSRRMMRQLEGVLSVVQSLADSPLMSTATSNMSDRLDTLAACFQEEHTDTLARMTIARYPDLPINQLPTGFCPYPRGQALVCRLTPPQL